MTPEEKLRSLGIELPPAPKPVATYITAVEDGDLLYVSGHGPLRPDRTLICGRLGADLTIEQGYAAARQTGLAILATVRAHLGSLDRVDRLLKVLGMVNAAPDFQDHPKVINGCSDLFVEIFGDRGRGARSAVGMGSLPGGIATEVEAIFRIRPAQRA